MLDERIEAGVLRDDVKERGRILVRERADVVGDVEAGRLQDGVLGAGPRGWRACARAMETFDWWAPGTPSP
jgi:hypothetical protein